jgi:hypothetical protein
MVISIISNTNYCTNKDVVYIHKTMSRYRYYSFVFNFKVLKIIYLCMHMDIENKPYRRIGCMLFRNHCEDQDSKSVVVAISLYIDIPAVELRDCMNRFLVISCISIHFVVYF